MMMMSEHMMCERVSRIKLLTDKRDCLMDQLREAVVRCEYLRMQIEETRRNLDLLLDQTKKSK